MNTTSASGSLRERMATRVLFLVAGCALAAWAPMVPFARERLQLDPSTLGLLLLCGGMGSIGSMPVAGGMVARFGCRFVMVLAAVVTSIALPVLTLANSLPLMAMALVAFGAGVGTLDVAVNIQAVLVEKAAGRKLMSGFHGMFSLGGIIGAGSVSTLLVVGVEPLTCAVAVTIPVLLALVYAYSGLLGRQEDESGAGSTFVLPRGRVIALGGLAFLIFLAEGSVLDWSGLLLVDLHGAAVAQGGLGYLAFSIAMTIGRLTGDRVVATLGPRLILVLGGSLCAAGFACAVVAPTSAIAIAGFVLIGLGAANIVPVVFSATGTQTAMSPSTAIAAVSTIGYAGILAGPAAIGQVADVVGLNTTFLLLAASIGLIALLGPMAVGASAKPASDAHTIRVARVWRGRVARARADEYQAYLLENGIPPLQKTALAVQLLREDRETESEFVTISWWESITAMSRFAGRDPRRIHHLLRDDDFLAVPPTLQVLINIDIGVPVPAE